MLLLPRTRKPHQQLKARRRTWKVVLASDAVVVIIAVAPTKARALADQVVLAVAMGLEEEALVLEAALEVEVALVLVALVLEVASMAADSTGAVVSSKVAREASKEKFFTQ